MHKLSLKQLSEQLQTKQITSVELTKYFLARIEQHNQELNCFITVTSDLALEMAAEADKQLAAGNSHPLTGIPIAHQDSFCTLGVKTSAGSKMLDNFVAPYDAEVVAKLKALQMPILGKTNMAEFAAGVDTNSSFYGKTINPFGENLPVGASASAVAVAAGLAPIATSADADGTLRQAAANCGLVGIKPTYGAVSRFGLVAYASSFEQAGLIAKTAEDAALVLQQMVGFDEKDSTSEQFDTTDYQAWTQDLTGLKIGFAKQLDEEVEDAEILAAVEQAKAELQKLGATLVEVDLPHQKYAARAHYLLTSAEASSNLSRYDGVRYGYRCENPQDLEDLYKRSRYEAFGDEVKHRLLAGAFALSAQNYDKHYLQAQRIRRLVQQDYQQAFANCDLILAATRSGCAEPEGFDAKHLAKSLLVGANMAGAPAISLPAGQAGDLPISVQLIGQNFSEAQLLNAAYQFQQATDFHQIQATKLQATKFA